MIGKREENLKQFKTSREDLLYILEKVKSSINNIRSKDPAAENNIFLLILDNLIVQSCSLMQRIGDNAYNLPQDRLISYHVEMQGLIAEFEDITTVDDNDNNDNDNNEFDDDELEEEQ
jgi:hypothetical protein